MPFQLSSQGSILQQSRQEHANPRGWAGTLMSPTALGPVFSSQLATFRLWWQKSLAGGRCLNVGAGPYLELFLDPMP